MISVGSAYCSDTVKAYDLSSTRTIIKYSVWSVLEVTALVLGILGFLKVAPFNGMSSVGCYCLVGTSALLLMIDFCNNSLERMRLAPLLKTRRETISTMKKKYGAVLVYKGSSTYLKNIKNSQQFRVWTEDEMTAHGEYISKLGANQGFVYLPKDCDGVEFIQFKTPSSLAIMDHADFFKAIIDNKLQYVDPPN